MLTKVALSLAQYSGVAEGEGRLWAWRVQILCDSGESPYSTWSLQVHTVAGVAR